MIFLFDNLSAVSKTICSARCLAAQFLLPGLEVGFIKIKKKKKRKERKRRRFLFKFRREKFIMKFIVNGRNNNKKKWRKFFASIFCTFQRKSNRIKERFQVSAFCRLTSFSIS